MYLMHADAARVSELSGGITRAAGLKDTHR